MTPNDWVEAHGGKIKSAGSKMGIDNLVHYIIETASNGNNYYGSIRRIFYENGNDYYIEVGYYGFDSKAEVANGRSPFRAVFDTETATRIESIIIEFIEFPWPNDAAPFPLRNIGSSRMVEGPRFRKNWILLK